MADRHSGGQYPRIAIPASRDELPAIVIERAAGSRRHEGAGLRDAAMRGLEAAFTVRRGDLDVDGDGGRVEVVHCSWADDGGAESTQRS